MSARVGATFLGALAVACAGSHERPRPPPPASSSSALPAPSAAPSPSAEPAADAGNAVALKPSTAPPELSKERAALAENLARHRWVIRGRVREAKEVIQHQAGGAVRYHYAIIDVLEWIDGDAKGVHKAYAKSFPIWNTPIPVSVNTSPALGHRDPPLELVGRAGEERLFLVSLPHEDNLSHGEPGPPAFISKRWGKYSVVVGDHLPLDQRDEIAATKAEVERRRAWIKENAERLQVRDRFRGEKPEAVADAVARFVVEELRRRAQLKVEHGAPEHVGGDTERFRFPLSGDADAAGTLGVSVDRTTSRVRHFQLDVPFVKKAVTGKVGARAEVLADAKSTLGLGSETGELFGQASESSRGDGLTFWRVVLHAGTLHGNRIGASKMVNVSMTRGAGVVFEYKNGWAGP